MKTQITASIIMVIAAAVFVSADTIVTTNGEKFKNATISRVEPDGLVITHSAGVAKVPFTELPAELQRKYHYDPKEAEKFAAEMAERQRAFYLQAEEAKKRPKGNAQTAEADARRAQDLMSQADSAMRNRDFVASADLLNRIASEYPGSPQAGTVNDLKRMLREKQTAKDGPFTVGEAERLRSVMDALVKIKMIYGITTPEKRRALEALLGTETFRDSGSGLDSLSTSAGKLRDARDKALQEER